LNHWRTTILKKLKKKTKKKEKEKEKRTKAETDSREVLSIKRRLTWT